MGMAAAALAFSAGLVSFLSPCVVPVVPRYISAASGLSFDELANFDSEAGHERAVLGTIFFVPLHHL